MPKLANINCANVGDSEHCILFLADWTTLRPDPDTHLHRTGCHKCVTYFLRIRSAITIVAVAVSMRILSSTGLGSPPDIVSVVPDPFRIASKTMRPFGKLLCFFV